MIYIYIMKHSTKNITIQTRQSTAVYQWMSKEYGSWEDHDKDPNHACALLQRFGGMLELTEEQAMELITSGKYNSTAWLDDEIEGGAKTKLTIAGYVTKIQTALTNRMNSI
jgi:hypothetical protein